MVQLPIWNMQLMLTLSTVHAILNSSQDWSARRGPHEARFRSRLEGGGFLGEEAPDPGLQARTLKVNPPRPCPDLPATHPCQEADCQCPQVCTFKQSKKS